MSAFEQSPKIYRLIIAILIAVIVLLAIAGVITLHLRIDSVDNTLDMVRVGSSSIQGAYYLFTLDEQGDLKAVGVQRRISQNIEGAKNLFTELLSVQGQIGFETFSLIPSETKLLSLSIEGDVLYIDFSEDFRFNPWGSQGYAGQLQQVLSSAASLKLAKYAQITIEGKQLDFLHEGVYIGRPLALNVE